MNDQGSKRQVTKRVDLQCFNFHSYPLVEDVHVVLWAAEHVLSVAHARL